MCNVAYHISMYIIYIHGYVISFIVLLDFKTLPMYSSHEILHELLFYYHLFNYLILIFNTI